MRPSLRLVRALLFAVALLAGQHVAALHDLAHAKEQLSQKDAKPGSSTCDQCAACAQLSGGAAATTPVLPVDDVAPAQVAVSLARDAACAPRLAFRSRAPPTLL
ncbi:MAG TPA: hypothetical protein VKR38_02880 [Usitatibacter sp.]|nr:hypothetical protein [Usitatibacter sp.]